MPKTTLEQAAFEASPDALVGVDDKGLVIVASPGTERMFGYACEEIIGNNIRTILPEYSEWQMEAGRHSLAVSQHQNGGQALSRLEGCSRQGDRFPVELIVTRAAGADLPFVLLSIRNVSGRKNLEDELARRVVELEGQSRTDKLTGLFNRRYFDEVLDLEFRRACRYQMPLSLMLIDIDYFKDYNDTYGHVKGDAVLSRFGKLLSANFRRSSDTAARYGGEEFAVIMGNCGLERARLQAETLFRALAEEAIEHRASSVSGIVTVSIGICTMVPAIGELQGTLLTESDRCLYKVKKELGRNAIHAVFRESV